MSSWLTGAELGPVGGFCRTCNLTAFLSHYVHFRGIGMAKGPQSHFPEMRHRKHYNRQPHPHNPHKPPQRKARSHLVTQKLIRIIRMKDKCSQFDTLPRCLMLCRGIHKSSMGHPARPTVKLRIEKFDQSDHIRRLFVAIVPLELWISFHGPPLHFSVREMNLDREKIRFRRGVRICDGQWVFKNGLDRTPDADHLVAVLEKLCCFIGKMVADSSLGSGGR